MDRLQHLSVIAFEGKDARQFLHNQLASDVLAIADGTAAFGCCCNPKGRAVALLMLARRGDHLWAACSAELADPLQTWLQRFVFREDVQIVARPDLAVLDATGGPREPAMVVEPVPGLRYRIAEAGEAEPGDALMLRIAELERGVSWLDARTSGEFLPQMLGYQSIGALSFRKGCYPGQEVIARTRHLGALKRHPVLVKLPMAAPLLESMEKVSLGSGTGTHEAVVIDTLSHQDAGWVRVVARAPEPLAPLWLEARGVRYPALA